MSPDEKIEREACRREIRRVLDKYGICTMLHSVADVLDFDNRTIEMEEGTTSEVERRDALILNLRTVFRE